MEKLTNMSKSNCSTFHYDHLVLIDENTSLEYIINLKTKFPNNNILGITFNHRLFSLNEKNIIKNTIDILDIDHLMFSIKPSCIKSIKNINLFDFNEFKTYAKINFLFSCILKYNIKSIHLQKFSLNKIVYSSNNIHLIENSLKHYFKIFIEILSNQYSEISLQKKFISIKPSKININDIDFHFIETDGLNNEIYFLNFKRQISEEENDLFWVGFDSNFKEVPWDKKYPETKWNKNIRLTTTGEALYEKKIKYCNRCCMPETMEGITFDEFGICTPCRSSEEKMHIDWEIRENQLNQIINTFKKVDYYDCLLPMSGGKDSMFQAYILTNKYGLTPLAVTHGANWMSLTGRFNLENCLQKFDLDHLIFHSKRSTIDKVARKSLYEIGDACWHCHIGAGTFSLQTAVTWGLNLLIWGESIAERDGRGSYLDQKEASVYYSLEVSAKVKAEDFSDQNVTENELSKWFFPNKQNLQDARIRYLHLGDFIFWDEEKQVDFVVSKFNWMNSKVENTFKGYKSNECIMAGVHDYSNFIKRGIGRATIQASDDIRRGLITREEGIEISKKFDTQRPHALDYYLKITNITEKEYEEILLEARNKSTYASKLNK